MHTHYTLQFCSQKSGDISIISDTWSRTSLRREKENACKRSEPQSQGCFLTAPTLSEGAASHQFLTHVNGPLQYLMFLYGVLTIECRNGMRIWLLGRGAYPSSQQSYALRRRARRRDESSGEFSGEACDVLPTPNPGIETSPKYLFEIVSPFCRGYSGYSSLWWVIMGCNSILI